MSSTTLLLDSPELEKTCLIEKDEHITIYKTCHHANGRLYTLTILKGNREDSISGDIHREFEIIRDLDHPNIVKCYEISSRDNGIHVLSEFFTSKSLLGSHITDESSLSDLTRQILLALSYLHKRNLVHGEIRPSRFFIDSIKGCAKIAYFGRIVQENLIHERIQSLDGFSRDVWSLGLSILELYFGSSLHDTKNPCFGQTTEAPATASAEFKDFISCCLQKDSAKIWNAEKLLQHPFILQNTKSGTNLYLQGYSLGEETEVQKPFLSSSSASLCSSMTLSSKAMKLSESTLHLSPEPEDCSDGRTTVPEGFHGGKADEQNVKSKQTILGFKRSMSERSLLVQRCAKRKRLKEKANEREMPKELSTVDKNNSSLNKEKMSESSSTESVELEFRQEKRMHFMRRAEDSQKTVQGADFEFESLPGYAKSCILYCSLFPFNYEFDKDSLVQLWIAEELIDLEVSERMEDDGKVCFDILESKEFIVPSSYDNLYGQQKYKVNESKASYWYTKEGLFSGDYQRIRDHINDISQRSMHLSLDMEEFDSSTFGILANYKHLHTLLLLGGYGSSIKQIPRNLFLSLKSLCTLDLSRTHISELPSTIGCLESLHYLDLSYTPIKFLPESVDSLYSLQTLKLRGCFALRALPEGITNLINLRHLDLDIVRQLASMPKGMGSLIHLQTLKAFVVGKDDGHRIGELKNLNNLTGSFCISGLEKVVNIEEAVKASLSTKQYLNKLELRWGEAERDEATPEEEILECLQPHYGLKELHIQFYNGSMFPSWIGNPSFDKIISITIYKCIECQVLPSIGNLPSLKFLNVVGLNSVKDLNGLFGRDHGSKGHCAFPKLEKLTLDNMLNLQKLTGAENGDFPFLLHVFIRYCPKLADLSLLSHLKKLKNLEISHCIELLSLPEVGFPASVESLLIRGCPNLKQRYHKNGGEDWCKIAHIPRVWIENENISCN